MTRSNPRHLQYWATPPVNPPPTPFFRSRAAALLAGMILFLGIVCTFAQSQWPVVLGGFLTDGAIALAWVASAAMAGDLLMRVCRLAQEDADRPLRLVTAAGLGLGIYSLIVLGLGLAGWINRTTILLLPLLSVVGWLAARLRSGASDRGRISSWLGAPVGWSVLWLAAVPFLAVTATAASIMPGWLWRPNDPHPYDVLSYHLQIQREWYQAGRIVPLYHNVFSFFPTNQEMHYLAAMELRGGPWEAMYVCQFINLIITILAVLAVRGLVVANFGATTPQEQRQARAAGAVAGVMAASVPWVVMLGSVPYVESGFLFFGILCAAWALRAVLRPRMFLRHMMLAGALAGFAGGVKYTAVPMVLLAVPVALLAAISLSPVFRGEGRGEGPVARVGKERAGKEPLTPTLSPEYRGEGGALISGCALFLLAGVLALSPWLLRNWVWAGNPIFPVAMRWLGHGYFTPVQIERFTVAHSPAPMDAGLLGHLHEMWRQIFAGWQFAYIVVPLGFLAAAATCRRIAGRFMLTVLLIQLIIWAGFTHLLPRFFVPAVPFAAAAVGLSLRGRPPWAGASVMAAAVILGLIALLPTVSRELQNETVKFLFDFKDLARLEPDVLSTLERGNYKVALIGDAQAFLDQASRDHLLYRSVFDVNIPPGQNVVDGWLGPGHTVEQLRRDGYIVIINTSELNRLSKTYRGIPPVPPQWQRPNFEPIILPPD